MKIMMLTYMYVYGKTHMICQHCQNFTLMQMSAGGNFCLKHHIFQIVSKTNQEKFQKYLE